MKAMMSASVSESPVSGILLSIATLHSTQ